MHRDQDLELYRLFESVLRLAPDRRGHAIEAVADPALRNELTRLLDLADQASLLPAPLPRGGLRIRAALESLLRGK